MTGRDLVGRAHCPACERAWPPPHLRTGRWGRGGWLVCPSCGAVSIVTGVGFTRQATETELVALNADYWVRRTREHLGFPLKMGA